MTLVACADCDTVIVQVPMGIDVDSIDLSKYNCPSCGVYDENTGEIQTPPKALNTR